MNYEIDPDIFEADEEQPFTCPICNSRTEYAGSNGEIDYEICHKCKTQYKVILP